MAITMKSPWQHRNECRSGKLGGQYSRYFTQTYLSSILSFCIFSIVIFKKCCLVSHLIVADFLPQTLNSLSTMSHCQTLFQILYLTCAQWLHTDTNGCSVIAEINKKQVVIGRQKNIQDSPALILIK